jgi:hypothetical protein
MAGVLYITRPPFCVLAGELAMARELLRTQSVLLAKYVAFCGKSGWLKMFQHLLSQATAGDGLPGRRNRPGPGPRLRECRAGPDECVKRHVADHQSDRPSSLSQSAAVVLPATAAVLRPAHEMARTLRRWQRSGRCTPRRRATSVRRRWRGWRRCRCSRWRAPQHLDTSRRRRATRPPGSRRWQS